MDRRGFLCALLAAPAALRAQASLTASDHIFIPLPDTAFVGGPLNPPYYLGSRTFYGTFTISEMLVREGPPWNGGALNQRIRETIDDLEVHFDHLYPPLQRVRRRLGRAFRRCWRALTDPGEESDHGLEADQP